MLYRKKPKIGSRISTIISSAAFNSRLIKRFKEPPPYIIDPKEDSLKEKILQCERENISLFNNLIKSRTEVESLKAGSLHWKECYERLCEKVNKACDASWNGKSFLETLEEADIKYLTRHI